MKSVHRDIQAFLQSSTQPLIVIIGPTASGKTAFSLECAHEIEGMEKTCEIVNADSRQLYRYLDIGTAKITTDEMEGISHHLLDVCNPTDELTVGMYQTMAKPVLREISDRGHVPMLVGGSMLYVSSIIDSFSLAPVADEAMRMSLTEEYDKDTGASLYAQLKEIDPESAAYVHPHNKPALIRAVEIYKTSGLTASTLKKKRSCPYDLLIYGIQWDRSHLRTRIADRTQELFERGWIEEVKTLLEMGYTGKDPGMKSHGYREIIAYIQNWSPHTLTELKQRITIKTCQYAKRQMTWWRGDTRIQWIDGAPIVRSVSHTSVPVR